MLRVTVIAICVVWGVLAVVMFAMVACDAFREWNANRRIRRQLVADVYAHLALVDELEAEYLLPDATPIA